MDIIDVEKEDLLRAGLSAEAADNVLGLIESLTVEEGSGDDAAAQASSDEMAEARSIAEDIFGVKLAGPDEEREAAETTAGTAEAGESASDESAGDEPA